MKNVRYHFYLYPALALLCFPSISLAQLLPTSESLITYHTTLCGAVTSQHHGRLEYRKLGVVNTDPETAAWVNCPATLSTEAVASGIPEDIALTATNTGDQALDLQCIYRVTDWST